MGRIQSDEFQEALDAIDMEDFLSSENIEYKVTPGTSGVQLNLHECPRCGGRGWKVYLNMDSGLGKCFHGACADEPGFNKFTFIDYTLNQGRRKTVSYILDFAKTSGWRPKKKQAVATEIGDVVLPQHFKLPMEYKGNKRALPLYLTSRGVTPEIAEYFGLMYCHEGSFSYKMDGEEKKQDYSRRILIPVYDLSGALRTFQGRDITGESERKYLFPPGLAGSGRYLFNGQNCTGLDEIVVGEGAFDVIAIKMALDTQVDLRGVGQVGTFGKHLSDLSDGDNQTTAIMELIRSGLKRITFMWDGEPKALMEAVAAGEKVKSLGVEVRIAELPLDKDPAEVDASVVVAAYRAAVKLNKASIVALKLRYGRMIGR